MTDSLYTRLGTALTTGASCAGGTFAVAAVGTPGLPDEFILAPVAGVTCAVGGFFGVDMVQAVKDGIYGPESVVKATAEVEKAAEELAKQQALQAAAEKAAAELAKQQAAKIAAKKLAEEMAKQTSSLKDFHNNGTVIVKEVLKGQTPVPVVDYSDAFSKPAVVATNVCTSSDELASKALEATEAAQKAAQFAETQRLATEAAQKAAEAAKKGVEAAKKSAEEALAQQGILSKGISYVASSYNFAMSYINPAKDAIATGYSQYAEPAIESIPYVGSTVNDTLKFVGNNNLKSAMGAYKMYSAYGVLTSDKTAKEKALALAEAALPLVARPLAEAVVNATGIQQSAGMVEVGIMLAPTAVRATVGVVKGTGRALTFAYGKCFGKAAVVEKQAADVIEQVAHVIEQEVVVEKIIPQVKEEQKPVDEQVVKTLVVDEKNKEQKSVVIEQLVEAPVEIQQEQEIANAPEQVATIELPKPVTFRPRSNSQEKLVEAAQNLKNAMNVVVAVVKLEEGQNNPTKVAMPFNF